MAKDALGIRKRLVQLVEQFPGLHLREIARQAEMSEALALYHLDQLEEGGVVESRTEEQFRRFFPVEAPSIEERDRDLMALLRQRVPLQIALYLLAEGEATHGDITDQLELAKSTVSYHLDKLGKADFVTQEAGRFRLREPRRVERLLLRWEPPRSLTDRFTTLWTRFYRGRR